MTAASPCRLALCDDAFEFIQLLRLLFATEAGIEVVGDAGDGNEAVDLCERTHPDVLLLDVAMPGRDGVDALPDILRVSPRTKVIIYTGFASRDVERQALERGAHSVLLKGMAPDELLRHVLRAHTEAEA